MKTKILSLALFFVASCVGLSYGQSEYDDLYFTPKDRKSNDSKIEEAAKPQAPAATPQTSQGVRYQLPGINDYTGEEVASKNVNPDYIDRYNNGIDEDVLPDSESFAGDDYFPEDYAGDELLGTEEAQQVVVNNYYNDPRINNGFYDPYWDWRWNRFGWNRGWGWNNR